MKRFIPLITVLLIIAAYFSSCSSRSSKSINTYVDKLIPEHEVHPMQEDEIQTLLDNFDLNADDYGVSVTVVVWHDRNDQIAYIFECGSSSKAKAFTHDIDEFVEYMKNEGVLKESAKICQDNFVFIGEKTIIEIALASANENKN